MSAKTKEPKEKVSFKEMIRRTRLDYFITSILCIAVGVYIFIQGEAAINICGWILAAALIITGVVSMVIFFVKLAKGLHPSVATLIIGATVIVVGFWVYKNTIELATLVVAILGIIMIAHAGRGFYEAITAKEMRKDSYGWAIPLAFAVINLALGIVSVLDSFEVLLLEYKILGVFLVVHGLMNLYTAGFIVHAVNQVKRAAKKAGTEAEQEPIDVTFEEAPVDAEPVETAETVDVTETLDASGDSADGNAQ